MRPRSHTLLLALAAAGVALLVIGVLALAGVFNQEGQPPPPVALARGAPSSADLVDRVGESLVSVVFRRGGEVHTAAGFLLDRQGTVVTAASPLTGARVMGIRAEGASGTIAAGLQLRDRDSGVAILKIARDDARDIRPIGVAAPDSVRAGEAVLAIGAPFALNGVVSSGVVSALDREAVLPGGARVDGTLATDSEVRAGNLGGPLIDPSGKAIGLLLAEGMDAVEAVANEAAKSVHVRSPSLGLSTVAVDFDPGVPASLGLKVEHGLLVRRVVAGGPAARAGIRAARPDGSHGDVIVAIAGRQVRRPADVEAAVAGYRPGRAVDVQLARGGRQLSLRLRLGR
jgi:S1-C subfamily serine protease